MPLPAFPNIAMPDVEIVEGFEDPAISTPFEAGYEQSRARFTRSRNGPWQIKWRDQEPLSAADYALLETFLKTTVRGGSLAFTWTHPVSGTSYNVRCTASEFTAVDYDGVYAYAGSLTLREV